MPLAIENERIESGIVRRTKGEDRLYFQIPLEFEKVLASGNYKATVHAGYLSIDITAVKTFKKE